MERVFIGMSGGVDSSVAAALLKERGYDIVGVTLRLKPGDGADGDIEDAKNVAKALKIEHCVLDLRGEFKEKVMDYFAAEYLRGATPSKTAAIMSRQGTMPRSTKAANIQNSCAQTARKIRAIFSACSLNFSSPTRCSR